MDDRGQTAIPSSIRKHLGLEGGGKIEYEIDEAGQVVIRLKPEAEVLASDEADPALRPFLALLEQDIKQSPARLEPMESDFMAVAIALTGSWQNLVDFDPSSFDFTEDDAAKLAELIGENDTDR